MTGKREAGMFKLWIATHVIDEFDTLRDARAHLLDYADKGGHQLTINPWDKESASQNGTLTTVGVWVIWEVK